MPRTYTTFAVGLAHYPLGTYTVLLALDDAAAPGWARPAAPVPLDVLDVGDLTYDTPEAPVGTGLYGASLALTLDDPDGYLAEPLLAGRADPASLRLTLFGPDGHGGVMTWAGRYVPADADETLAPLVYGTAEVVTEWACGIGAAEDAPAVDAGGLVLGAVAGLTRLAEHAAAVRLSPARLADGGGSVMADAGGYTWVTPPVWEASSLLGGRYEDGPDRFLGTDPSGGTLADQLDALARCYGLVVYLSLRQPTPEWHVMPRWALGLDVPDATTLPAAAPSPAGTMLAARTFPASRAGRTVTIPGTWSADGRLRLRAAAREVAIRYPEGSLLNADPGFADAAAWTAVGTPAFGSGQPIGAFVTLGAGDGLRQTLGGVAGPSPAQPGTTGARVLVRLSAFSFDVATGDPLPLPRVRISVASGATTYYWDGSSWVTTTAQASAALERGDDGEAVLASPAGHWCRVFTGALPAEGELTVTLLSPAGEATTLYRAEVTLADAAGLILYRLAVATGGPYASGPPDEIEVPASVALDPRVTAGDDWVAEPSANVYTDHATAVAACRVAITAGEGGAPLRVVDAEVPGLLGPDTRVVFDGAGVGPIVCGFSGGALSPKRGVTVGTWTEIAPAPASALGARTLSRYAGPYAEL